MEDLTVAVVHGRWSYGGDGMETTGLWLVEEWRSGKEREGTVGLWPAAVGKVMGVMCCRLRMRGTSSVFFSIGSRENKRKWGAFQSRLERRRDGGAECLLWFGFKERRETVKMEERLKVEDKKKKGGRLCLGWGLRGNSVGQEEMSEWRRGLLVGMEGLLDWRKKKLNPGGRRFSSFLAKWGRPGL